MTRLKKWPSLILFSIAVLSASTSPASKNVEKFCFDMKEGIPSWPKKMTIEPGNTGRLNEGLFAGIAQIITPKEAGKHLNEKKWIFIDNRIQQDRAPGVVPRALLMTVESLQPKEEEMSAQHLIASLNSMSKADKEKLGLKDKYTDVTEMSDLNFVTYCNGRQCHRAPMGACKLRKMGFTEKQVHLLVEGFPGWQEAGLPVK